MKFKKITAILIAAVLMMNGLCIVGSADSAVEDFVYDISSGNAVITEYKGDGGSVVIPAICAVGGKLYDVVEIGEEAFAASSVSKIEISEGILKISESAFWDCDGLGEVIIPESVTEICDYAFDDCNNLVNVTVLNDKATVGESAFGYYAVGRRYYIVENFVLHGSSGSTAEKYATKNGMTFKEYVKPILGDANNDGSLNIMDLVRLKKTLATLDGKIDINGDGKCTAADMVTLKLLLLNGVSGLPMHTVTFKGSNGSILKVQKIRHSFAASAPEAPALDGLKFSGWSTDFSNIMADTEIRAVYEADNKPTFTVDKVSAKAGEGSVTVAVRVKNNPGIIGMTLSVEYDEENLTLTDATNGEALKGILNFTSANVLKSGCNFLWDGQDLVKSDIKNGSILYLTFDVSAKAESGSYPIKISYMSGNIIDIDLNPIEFEIEDGSININ